MPLYQEQTVTETVTKTTFVRSNLVTIDNALNQTPFITYSEEKVERVDDGPDKSLGNVGSLSEFLTAENVSEQFSVLDRNTGDVVGTATYGEVHALIYSLYFHLAAKRDASGD